jgi:DNA-binding transcriptional regulator LsrR (DeoR family)
MLRDHSRLTLSFTPPANHTTAATGVGAKQKEIINRRADLHLITRIAKLYHQERLTQNEIADKLGLSQVSVSRSLKRAEEQNIVRTTVISPGGAFLDLEELLERKFGLRQVLVAEASRDSEESILTAVGVTAAHYLETTVRSGEVIGVPDWSAYLLSIIQHMRPLWKIERCKAVQMVGGVGNPSGEEHANHLTNQLAALVQGEPHFLPAPGIVGSASSVQILANDPYVSETMRLFDQISLALLEIGSVEPSAWVSGHRSASSEEAAAIREQGAVGNICLRSYDSGGIEIREPLGERVVGLAFEQLKKIPRAVGMAGGKQRLPAILGALQGRWINILITDQFTAKRLTMA